MKDPIWNLTPEQAKPYREAWDRYMLKKRMTTKRKLKQQAVRRTTAAKHMRYADTHKFSAVFCDTARADAAERALQKTLKKERV